MYLPSDQLAGLGHLGKRRGLKRLVKSVVRAPVKLVKAQVKVAKKVIKAAPKVVKKLAPVAALAAGAYFAPGIAAKVLPALMARRRAADGSETLEPADASVPAPISAPEAIATAAQSYYASRRPRPTPPQSSPDEEAEAAEGQPVTAAGFSVGGVKVPPALIAAAIGIPLIVIALREPRGRRR